MTLNAVRLREMLAYDAGSGVFRWLVRPSNRVRIGEPAGTLNQDGYIQIRLDGRIYYAHRLAWLYVTGQWPDEEIDHRNTVRSDNRWANLRPATRAENAANLKRGVKNTSGFKGVYWHKADGKWMARIRDGGKTIYLGSFDDPTSAHTAYIHAARRLHGEFARAA